jgi:hypothetical protein
MKRRRKRRSRFMVLWTNTAQKTINTFKNINFKVCYPAVKRSMLKKVILSPNFRKRMKWSGDGSLTNHMSQFLFMFLQMLPMKRPVLYSVEIWKWISTPVLIVPLPPTQALTTNQMYKCLKLFIKRKICIRDLHYLHQKEIFKNIFKIRFKKK